MKEESGFSAYQFDIRTKIIVAYSGTLEALVGTIVEFDFEALELGYDTISS